MKFFRNLKKNYFSNFDLKFIFQIQFLPTLVNFMNYMQKQFSDVLQMPLVPEIPIFILILKLLDPENENIEFSKKIFQAHLNGTSACKN